MLPTIAGTFLVMHFGSKPMSLVCTPVPVLLLPMSVDADDASVKSGLVPSGDVKYATEPVPTMLFDQPVVGCPKTGVWPGPVPVPMNTLFIIETPVLVAESVK